MPADQPAFVILPFTEAAGLLGLGYSELRVLASVELLEQQWVSGRRQHSVKLPVSLLERGVQLGDERPVARTDARTGLSP